MLFMQDWLVIQIRPRWEKKVARLLCAKGIETFCPVVKEQHQWSDRLKTVDVPLLKSYIFVRINGSDRTYVRLTEGVINFLYNNGKPVVIKDKLIQGIRQFQQSHPQLKAVQAENSYMLASSLEGTSGKAALWIDTINILLVTELPKPLTKEASIDKI